jgi:hypothetical protein
MFIKMFNPNYTNVLRRELHLYCDIKLDIITVWCSYPDEIFRAELRYKEKSFVKST